MSLIAVRLWRIEGYLFQAQRGLDPRNGRQRSVFLAQERFPSTEEACVALLFQWSDRPHAAAVESIVPAAPPQGVAAHEYRVFVPDD